MVDEKKNGKTSRTVLLVGSIDEERIKVVTEKFVELASTDPTKEITLILDTYGGYVDSMFTLHDLIKAIPCVVRVVGMGKVMSAGVLILACAEKRYLTPNCRVMMHQISGFTFGSVSDLDISVAEIKRLQKKLFSLLAKYSETSRDEIEEDFSRDKFMSAKEAVAYGLADGVLPVGTL